MLKHFTVLNKKAGRFSPTLYQQICSHTINGEGITGRVIATEGSSDLEKFLAESAAESCDILGIGGGDGTFAETITAVMKMWGDVPAYIAPYGIGTINNVTLAVGLNGKPLEVARYVGSLTSVRGIAYRSLSLLKINQRYGFNVGFGLVPKLVWLYEGHSIRDYELFIEKPQSFPTEAAKRSESLLRRLPGRFRALRASFLGIAGAVHLSSSAQSYFNEELDVKIYIDGKKFIPSSSRPATAIMTAAYEQVSLGLFLMPEPLPGARAVEGKMRVLITTLTPEEGGVTTLS